ncbi:uncharacterized protein LOC111339885 [Stylophora pistillata]|uniref:uncharacterized protein LOC111339885 n=1 Tax=Stylophora pistillata TaxID=50429 RepID=UPI000C0537CD|nr:uncharacterized protein LOC111339885 [Stylophora pistillata]
MLHAMFSGRFDTKPDEDGTYFIDRDGTHFRYILNYLRTGELVVPDDKTVRHELLIEAKFYHVEGMIKALTPKPAFEGSEILSRDQGKTLMKWLKKTPALDNVSNKLLYRASRDGWNASNFHSCCDNKGPTVTVIKSGDYIFGGYSQHPWQSPAHGSGSFKRALTSFLFSLVNPGGLPPTKISLTPGNESNSIYCHSNYGPTFGGNHDLYVANAPNSGNCYTNLGNTYQCPTGQDAQKFLAGSGNFSVSEMEVFGFKKQN